MKFIEPIEHREPTSAATDEVHNQHRGRFQARLRDERARLLDLAATLEQNTSDSSFVFEKLKLFAHQLRADATLYRFLEVAKAATALELAATAAALRRANHTDASVRLMIDALAERLASVESQHRDECQSGNRTKPQ